MKGLKNLRQLVYINVEILQEFGYFKERFQVNKKKKQSTYINYYLSIKLNLE